MNGGASLHASDLPNTVTVTRSFPKPTPEWLRDHRAAEAIKAGGAASDKVKHKRATVNEECPKCKVRCWEDVPVFLRHAEA